jgi:hypothetical protein
VALVWLIASVVNDPLGAPGSTPFYKCLPPVWGAAGGDSQFPITRGTKIDTDGIKTGPLDLKEKRDSPSRKSQVEINQQGAGSSGVPRSGRAATRVPAAEIQPRAGTNQWLDTYPRYNQKSLSWESVILTYHRRELVLLANLRQEKVRDTQSLKQVDPFWRRKLCLDTPEGKSKSKS